MLLFCRFHFLPHEEQLEIEDVVVSSLVGEEALSGAAISQCGCGAGRKFSEKYEGIAGQRALVLNARAPKARAFSGTIALVVTAGDLPTSITSFDLVQQPRMGDSATVSTSNHYC